MEGRDATGGAGVPGSHLQHSPSNHLFGNLVQRSSSSMGTPSSGGVHAPAALRAVSSSPISLATPTSMNISDPSTASAGPVGSINLAMPAGGIATMGMGMALTGSLSTAATGPGQGPGPGPASAPLPGGGGAGAGAPLASSRGPVETQKRKRGRPRKYGANDGASPAATSMLALTNNSSPGVVATPVSPSEKRGRGRPPGSGKKQQLAALGSAGQGFTPHVITIAAGEDVATKIMAFAQLGTRAVCVMSANGAISNVTLRQPATSGGTVTYEGRFEILSLSGSLLSSDAGGTRSRTGGLSVSLAGPDGRVVGGGVGGMLTAASPVQVVVGSFVADSGKSQATTGNGDSPGATTVGAMTPLRTPKNESTGPKGASSPLSQSVGGSGSGVQTQSQVLSQVPQPVNWAGGSAVEARRNADMNEPPHERCG